MSKKVNKQTKAKIEQQIVNDLFTDAIVDGLWQGSYEGLRLEEGGFACDYYDPGFAREAASIIDEKSIAKLIEKSLAWGDFIPSLSNLIAENIVNGIKESAKSSEEDSVRKRLKNSLTDTEIADVNKLIKMGVSL